MCLIQWAVSLALTRKEIMPKRARFVSCRQSQATDWSVVLAGGRTRTAGLLLREAGQPLALDVTRRRPRRRRRHQHTQARAAAPSPGLRGRAPPERRQAPRTPERGPDSEGAPAFVSWHKPNAKQERGKVVTKGKPVPSASSPRDRARAATRLIWSLAVVLGPTSPLSVSCVVHFCLLPNKTCQHRDEAPRLAGSGLGGGGAPRGRRGAGAPWGARSPGSASGRCPARGLRRSRGRWGCRMYFHCPGAVLLL